MNPQAHKWHLRFLKLAEEVADWSKDPSTKVACILVKDRRIISTGFNGFPRGISDDLETLLDRDKKYEITVHAEVNAVTAAALHGVSTDGCTAYVTFTPCSRCASVLINAGIKEVYVINGRHIPQRWVDNFQLASKILYEAGVHFQALDPT
jgi:dCMP deaminase